MADIAIPRETPNVEDYDEDDTGTEMYFRTPNGEIHISRIGMDESEKIKRVRDGWVPLDNYGTFKIQPYHAEHPFEVLFQRGGAKELSPKEIIEQGFYFRPPLVPVCNATVGESFKNSEGQRGHKGGKRANTRHTPKCWVGAQPVAFPQLADEALPEGPFLCKWCGDEGDGEKRFATARGLRQHETVMHPDEIGSDRLAQQLIAGLGGGAKGTGDLDLHGEMLKMREQIEALTAGNPHYDHKPPEFAPAATPYVCGLCGEALPNAFGLNKHISAHKNEAVPA